MRLLYLNICFEIPHTFRKLIIILYSEDILCSNMLLSGVVKASLVHTGSDLNFSKKISKNISLGLTDEPYIVECVF